MARIHPDPPERPAPRRLAIVARLAVALAAAALIACAGPRDATSPTQSLRERIAAGDLAGADALIAAHPGVLDARRALDLAIRGGDAAAVRHYAPRAGVDAELDLDGTTPLIRAVLDAPAADRPALVAALMAGGARPALRDRYGRSALDYAIARNMQDLLVLLDGDAAQAAAPDTPAVPAFAAWLAATPAAAPPLPAAGAGGGVARTAPRGPEAVRVTPVRPPGIVPRGAAPAPDAPERVSASMLMRHSPWLPDTRPDRSGTEVAALRFHGDGTADLLRHPVGSGRFEPMAQHYAAWTIDGERLLLAIVGGAFSATCVGTVAPAAEVAPPQSAAPGRGSGAGGPPPAARAARPAVGAPAPAPAAPQADALALLCEERLPALARDAGYSLDLARTMLVEFDLPPRPPSLYAIATGRVPAAGASGEAPPAPVAQRASVRLPVTLRGAAPAAVCRPGKGRPRAAAPSPRTLGDWHAFNAQRFQAWSPLSGRLCTQPDARDAAMRACRDASGRDARACRSVGGCPTGQAAALAGLPGVDAGWLACDADLGAARRQALAACRADLGCDCQLVTVSGRNLNTVSGAVPCAATPRGR